MLQSSQEIFNAVIGSAFLMIVLVTIILVATAKYFRKQRSYIAIETLLKKQELNSAYAMIQGQEEERKRIAEDLHDSIGGLLATLRMYSDLLHEKETHPDTKELSGKIAELSELAAEETRRISHHLGSGLLKNFGLSTSLLQLCEVVKKSHHLTVSATLDLQKEPDGHLSINIYRIVQELFTNTLKHARATTVRIEVTEIEDDYLSIIFEDNGAGFDTTQTPTGMGLQNIKARIERFQGILTIDANAQRGTTVIIEIPLHHDGR